MDIQEEHKKFFNELDGRGFIFKNKTWLGGCFEDDQLQVVWEMWQAAKASVAEGFVLFDGDALTYANGYSVKCEFDEQFDCHIFDVYKDGDCIKDGMTQLAQAHHLVVSMIQVEAQEPSND